MPWKGTLTADASHSLCTDGQAAGAPHVADLAKPGHHKNRARDMPRRLLKKSKWPALYWTEIDTKKVAPTGRSRPRRTSRQAQARGRSPRLPATYGMYQPFQRVNVDQIPFNLDNRHRKSYVPLSPIALSLMQRQPCTLLLLSRGARHWLSTGQAEQTEKEQGQKTEKEEAHHPGDELQETAAERAAEEALDERAQATAWTVRQTSSRLQLSSFEEVQRLYNIVNESVILLHNERRAAPAGGKRQGDPGLRAAWAPPAALHGFIIIWPPPTRRRTSCAAAPAAARLSGPTQTVLKAAGRSRPRTRRRRERNAARGPNWLPAWPLATWSRYLCLEIRWICQRRISALRDQWRAGAAGASGRAARAASNRTIREAAEQRPAPVHQQGKGHGKNNAEGNTQADLLPGSSSQSKILGIVPLDEGVDEVVGWAPRFLEFVFMRGAL